MRSGTCLEDQLVHKLVSSMLRSCVMPNLMLLPNSHLNSVLTWEAPAEVWATKEGRGRCTRRRRGRSRTCGATKSRLGSISPSTIQSQEGSWREQASGDRQLPELWAGHRLAGEHIEGPVHCTNPCPEAWVADHHGGQRPDGKRSNRQWKNCCFPPSYHQPHHFNKGTLWRRAICAGSASGDHHPHQGAGDSDQRRISQVFHRH